MTVPLNAPDVYAVVINLSLGGLYQCLNHVVSPCFELKCPLHYWRSVLNLKCGIPGFLICAVVRAAIYKLNLSFTV